MKLQIMTLCLLATAVLSGNADAQECSATLSWDAPTENADGSPLTDLAGYKIYWGTAPDVYSDSITLDNPAATSYLLSGLSNATYYFASTAYNTLGVESALSNTATKAVTDCTTGLTAIGGTVWSIRQQVNRIAFVEVGAVPAGTPCLETVSVNQFHGVDRDLVEWVGSVEPRVVLTLCR